MSALTCSEGTVSSSKGADGLNGGSAGQRGRLLGVHAGAAWQACPHLRGCGPLLPSWHHLADLLVPLLHQVSQHCVSLVWSFPLRGC